MTLIVAISRQLGSGGSYIGQAVARRLGIRYVDREILEQAARLLGVEEQGLEPLEERVSSFWARSMFSIGPPDSPYTPPPPSVSEAQLFEAECTIIREVARRSDAVIVGRGSWYVLREHPGLVRLFVHAREAVRVRRVRKTYKLADENEAREMVRRSDARRGRFVHSLTDRDWHDASLYDLAIDTESISLDAAADLVTGVVAPRPTGKSRG
jgi:cytidylate kinase